MGARRDFSNQALLDQRRSVYRGTIFAVAAYGAAMCEQGVSHAIVEADSIL